MSFRADVDTERPFRRRITASTRPHARLRQSQL